MCYSLPVLKITPVETNQSTNPYSPNFSSRAFLNKLHATYGNKPKEETRPATKGEKILARKDVAKIRFLYGNQPLTEACEFCGERGDSLLYSDSRRPTVIVCNACRERYSKLKGGVGK